MEIIFLGTSSGIPTKARNVSAIVVKKRNEKPWCLVDCGEGTQHQVLHTKLALRHLSAILITHVHGDHCYGLPGLLASTAMAGRKEPLTVVAPPAIKSLIETTQKLSDTYLTFKINFIDVKDLNQGIEVDDFLITAHQLSHRVPSFAYALEEVRIERALDSEKLHEAGIPAGPIWGEIQSGRDVRMSSGERLRATDFLLASRKPRRIIVGGDNDSPELLQAGIEKTDLLIHESTYTDEVSIKVGPEPQHCSARKIAQFAEGAQLKNLILTHFSARYQYGQDSDSSIDEIELEARQHYQGNLFLANDFDGFYLDREGDVQLIK